MSKERAYAETVWDNDRKQWGVYVRPEDPEDSPIIYLGEERSAASTKDDNAVEDDSSDENTQLLGNSRERTFEETLSEDIKKLEKLIKENPTYKKFLKRAEENKVAVINQKEQTQQNEGGYASAVSTMILTALVGIFSLTTPIFAYARWNFRKPPTVDSFDYTQDEISNITQQVDQMLLNTNTTDIAGTAINQTLSLAAELINSFYTQELKDAKDYADQGQDALEIAALSISSTIIVLTAFAFLLNNCIGFNATNKEKRKKGLYDGYLKALLERLPKVENEIRKKQDVTNALLDYFEIEKDKFVLDQKPPEKPEEDQEVVIHMPQSAQDHDIEQGKDVELAVIRKPEQHNLIDLLKQVIDERNDVKVYDRVKDTLDNAKGGTLDLSEKPDQVKKTVVELLKMKLIASGYWNELKDENIDLRTIHSIDDLLAICDNVETELGANVRKFIVEQLVDILEDKNRLLAISALMGLAAEAGADTTLASEDYKGSYIHMIDMLLGQKFGKLPERLKDIHTLIYGLKEDQRAKLIEYLKTEFKDADKGNLKQKFDKIIKAVSTAKELKKVVGGEVKPAAKSTGTEASDPEKDNEKLKERLMKLSAGGSDDKLDVHGVNNPHYWYSISDGMILLQNIRRQKLNYQKKATSTVVVDDKEATPKSVDINNADKEATPTVVVDDKEATPKSVDTNKTDKETPTIAIDDKADKGNDQKPKEQTAPVEEYRAVGGEEYGSLRENQEGIFIGDPYVTENFASKLQDDIAAITGNHKDRKNDEWEKMPRVLVLPILTGRHWRAVRVEIDYKNQQASILYDDPFGTERFDETVKAKIDKAVTQAIVDLMNADQLQSAKALTKDDIEIDKEDKQLDQQGKGKNGWDCGPIVLNNTSDYATVAVSNADFAKSDSTHYTLSSAATQNHAKDMEGIRKRDIETYVQVTSDNENVQGLVEALRQSASDTLSKQYGELAKDKEAMSSLEYLSGLKDPVLVSKAFELLDKLDKGEGYTAEKLKIVREYVEAKAKVAKLEPSKQTSSLEQGNTSTPRNTML